MKYVAAYALLALSGKTDISKTNHHRPTPHPHPTPSTHSSPL